MPASTTTDTTATDLTTITSIRDRYELPGPHATAVIGIPTPGTVGDDLDVRWSAIAADLAHRGASRQTIDHMDSFLRSTPRRGHPLLLTANDDSAACCWLGFDIEPSIRIGTLPALVPALHHAALSPASTIGAVIDRTGADLYCVGAFDIEAIRTIQGDEEHVHKAAGGGWSQARHQRHSEVIWERNAALIARGIIDEAERLATDGVVLTGDDREVRLVEDQLDHGRAGPVLRARAGGRHEPGTTERLHEAAREFRTSRNQQNTARALDDLREELGQQDQAIAGSVEVLEAITDNRVRTLFVDLVIGGRTPHVDATVRAALAHGADLVIGLDFDVHEGIAAILRVPYS